MAVTNQESTEYTNAFTTTPPVKNPSSDWHGRLRLMYFVHDQTGAGDATSDIKLVKLPPGRVRLHGKLSNLYVNWTTAVATIDVGWAAYTDQNGVAVAADPNGIDDGVSVETAGAIQLGSALAATGYTKEFESRDGVTILATTQDVGIIAGDDIAGVIAYTVD